MASGMIQRANSPLTSSNPEMLAMHLWPIEKQFTKGLNRITLLVRSDLETLNLCLY